MNEKTKAYLCVNPLETVEVILGKRADEWNFEADSLKILKCLDSIEEAKKEYLKQLNDTYLTISWSQFLEITKGYGFDYGYSKKFTNVNFLHSHEEEEIICFHKDKHLILHAESFENFVCTATVYGEIPATIDDLNQEQLLALKRCSYIENGDHLSVEIPVREGLIAILDDLTEVFTFSKTWTSLPFIWLLNAKDSKSKNLKVEEIVFEKLKACPKELQAIVGRTT